MTATEPSDLLKLLHAADQLAALSEDVAAFRARETYRLVRADNVGNHADQNVWVEWTYHEVEPIPSDEWGLRIGDIIHNVRGALDHMTWKLVVKHSGPNPPNGHKIQFPIYDSHEKFERGAKAVLDAVSPSARTALASAQPFNATAGQAGPHLLLWLQYLSNADKHRVLTVLARNTFEETSIDIEPPQPDTIETAIAAGSVLVDGVRVLRIEFHRPADSIEIVTRPRVVHAESIEVSPPAMWMPAGLVLTNIVDHVGDVLETLSAHL